MEVELVYGYLKFKTVKQSNTFLVWSEDSVDAQPRGFHGRRPSNPVTKTPHSLDQCL